MNIIIIGCGVVGAAIAYELSQLKGLKITVLDQKAPAQASTGAALGVLMGVISQKIKGKAWQMRQTSIRRYETLIPELEAITHDRIPFNRHGIISLCLEGEDLAPWEKLQEIRHSQNWRLEMWKPATLANFCPQVTHEKIIGAVYSPQDRQLNPTALTLALVKAAQGNGVIFQFGTTVLGMETTRDKCKFVATSAGHITGDWFIVAAGLGSTPLLNQIVDIRPVLGQALQLRLDQPLGNQDFQPVITGNDVHIVPIGAGDYWVGATVEFPSHEAEILPDQQLLESVRQQAIAFCPELATATILRTWSGLRPRPQGRPAPVIGKFPDVDNVLFATGHYRNGVLLAPATALAIREMICQF